MIVIRKRWSRKVIKRPEAIFLVVYSIKIRCQSKICATKMSE